jgi:two-component system cell cycle sensor histidine kinase/response regulator CckA
MDVNTETQTILLVDDEHAIRTLAEVYLQSAGYTVLTASDGAEALSVFHQHQDRIALLLSDVVMPQLDGPRLADAVLAMRPGLPVLFISGSTPDADRGWGCILKPFTSGELIIRVRQALSTPRAAAAQDH